MDFRKKERLLTYITGLLYYYGAVPCDTLWQLACDSLQITMSISEFKLLLQTTAADDASPYVFEFADGICQDIDVDDSEWVIKKQQEQTELPYRIISEEMAACLLNDHYIRLWTADELALYSWLEDRCGHDGVLALTLVTEYATLLKNGLPPEELAKKLICDLQVRKEDDMRQAAVLVRQFADATPLWILKGWRINELPGAMLT